MPSSLANVSESSDESLYESIIRISNSINASESIDLLIERPPRNLLPARLFNNPPDRSPRSSPPRVVNPEENSGRESSDSNASVQEDRFPIISTLNNILHLGLPQGISVPLQFFDSERGLTKQQIEGSTVTYRFKRPKVSTDTEVAPKKESAKKGRKRKAPTEDNDEAAVASTSAALPSSTSDSEALIPCTSSSNAATVADNDARGDINSAETCIVCFEKYRSNSKLRYVFKTIDCFVPN